MFHVCNVFIFIYKLCVQRSHYIYIVYILCPPLASSPPFAPWRLSLPRPALLARVPLSPQVDHGVRVSASWPEVLSVGTRRGLTKDGVFVVVWRVLSLSNLYPLKMNSSWNWVGCYCYVWKGRWCPYRFPPRYFAKHTCQVKCGGLCRTPFDSKARCNGFFRPGGRLRSMCMLHVWLIVKVWCW